MKSQIKEIFRNFNPARFITILTIAIVVNIINLSHLVVGFAKTSVDSIYLFTGHYYLDYFVYVQAIAQGIKGRWLHENPYSGDDSARTILGWWQYVIYGKLGGLFHLSAVQIYWLMVIIYSIILTFLIYIFIRKLLDKESFVIQILTLLIFIFATPFYRLTTGVAEWRPVPYEFWYSQNSLYQRFGATPHHYLSTIIVAVELILLAGIVEKITKTRAAIFLILMVFLLTFSPMQVINILSALGLITLLQLKKRNGIKLLFFMTITIVIILPAAFIIKILHSQMGILVRSSAADFTLNQKVPFAQFLLATGPIVLLAPLGIKPFFSKLTPFKKIFFCFVLSSIIFFFSPLSYFLGSYNARFLSGLNYVFAASLGLLGIKYFSSKIFSRSPIIMLISISVLFLFFLPYHLYYLKGRLTDVNLFTTVSYLPKKVIEGFEFLDPQPQDEIVLTAPAFSTGLFLPIFADKKVYIGKIAFTQDFDKKVALAEKFYWGEMEANEAKIFLQKNKIGFVVLTSQDMKYYSTLSLVKYNFLKEIYKNSDIVIYKII